MSKAGSPAQASRLPGCSLHPSLLQQFQEIQHKEEQRLGQIKGKHDAPCSVLVGLDLEQCVQSGVVWFKRDVKESSKSHGWLRR